MRVFRRQTEVRARGPTARGVRPGPPADAAHPEPNIPAHRYHPTLIPITGAAAHSIAHSVHIKLHSRGRAAPPASPLTAARCMRPAVVAGRPVSAKSRASRVVADLSGHAELGPPQRKERQGEGEQNRRCCSPTSPLSHLRARSHSSVHVRGGARTAAAPADRELDAGLDALRHYLDSRAHRE